MSALPGIGGVVAVSDVFPSVRASATTNTSSLAFNLPTAQAGDLLVVILYRGTTGNFTIPGWTVAFDAALAAAGQVVVAYKVATGSEGATQAFTQTGTTSTKAVCFSVKDAATIEFAASSSGTSSPADPPALTPASGSRKYLWLSLIGAVGSSATTHGGSSGYTTIASSDVVTAQYKQAETASENPGTSTISAGTVIAWRATTAAVRSS